MLAMVAYACHPCIEAEEGGSQIQGQYRLLATLPSNRNKQKLRIFAKLRRFQTPFLLILM